MKNKLNEEKVLLILELTKKTEATDSQIASLFNVNRVTINHIRNGHRWSHVTGIQPNVSNNETLEMQYWEEKDKPKSNKPSWWNEFVEEYITHRINEMIAQNQN